MPQPSRFAPFRAPLVPALACLLCAATPGASVAATLELRVVDELGRPIEHAVVSVLAGPPSVAPEGTVATIDQVERRFAPDVLAVQTGTSVAFPNSDDVRHHVYSFSRPNDFQIKLYHGEPGETVRFEHAGVVTLGCNIHDGMVGHLVVVDTPLHAVTGADGRASVDDVPAGSHALSAWHPDTGQVELDVDVPRGAGAVERTVELVARPAAAQPVNPLQSLFDD